MSAKEKKKWPTARATIKGIETPKGFKRTEETVPKDQRWDYPAFQRLTFERPSVKIWIDFSPDSQRHDAWLVASGHVEFDTQAGRRSFDRYGVEDSFYIDGPKSSLKDKHDSPAAQANAAIQHFLKKRIPEARERIGRSDNVPGIPFMVTPESRESITNTLKMHRTYAFMPSGFGTGYQLWTTKVAGSKPADSKTAKFFGFDKLWVSTFDAD